LPEHHYYYFQSTGDRPLALFRVSAKKSQPKVLRVDAEGNKRTQEEIDFVVVDGQVVEGKFWELK
jgi:hypothetical protein